MINVFISHVEEDAEIAREIAEGLEREGFSTWYYERDSLPGVDHLDQTAEAIEKSQAVLVLISTESLASNQVDTEVKLAHELGKRYVPVLKNLKHSEFQGLNRVWRVAMGMAATISIPPAGIGEILPRLVAGLRRMGIGSDAMPKEQEARAAAPALPELEDFGTQLHEAPVGLGEAQDRAAPGDVPQPEEIVAAHASQGDLPSQESADLEVASIADDEWGTKAEGPEPVRTEDRVPSMLPSSSLPASSVSAPLTETQSSAPREKPAGPDSVLHRAGGTGVSSGGEALHVGAIRELSAPVIPRTREAPEAVRRRPSLLWFLIPLLLIAGGIGTKAFLDHARSERLRREADTAQEQQRKDAEMMIASAGEESRRAALLLESKEVRAWARGKESRELVKQVESELAAVDSTLALARTAYEQGMYQKSLVMATQCRSVAAGLAGELTQAIEMTRTRFYAK